MKKFHVEKYWYVSSWQSQGPQLLSSFTKLLPKLVYYIEIFLSYTNFGRILIFAPNFQQLSKALKVEKMMGKVFWMITSVPYGHLMLSG